MTNQQKAVLLEQILKDRKLRVATTTRSHFWFFHFYFGHYVTYETAPFHKEMFALTEDSSNKAIVISAFRGSAKSSIMNLSYTLWSILGVQQKKFVLILGQTQEQARQHLKNIKEELERNALLRSDLGPFEEDKEWRSYSLILPKYGAKIMSASADQSIRGLRHGQHRPQLMIGDDLEDLSSVATRENRDKLHQWLTSELLPAGSANTKLVVIGTILHEDCLLKRLEADITLGKLNGVYKEYPLIDDTGKILWPGRYPTEQAVEEEKGRIGNDSAWSREFLLKIISRDDQIIKPEWVTYYDELPSTQEPGAQFRFAAVGVDLAVKQGTRNDYTAMVSAYVYGYDERLRIYILPHPVNERLEFPKTVERLKQLSEMLEPGQRSRLYIEDVGTQYSLVQELQSKHYPAEGIKLHGQDKAARLTIVSHYAQQAAVLFPRQGCEQLIQQLVGFGIEKHDDLADAFTLLVNTVMAGNNRKPAVPEVFAVSW